MEQLKTRHDNIKRIKSAKEVVVVDHKTKENMKEYNNYMEKQRLDKRLKEEKKKKETEEKDRLEYAMNIYNFSLKRFAIRKLYSNLELNQVFFRFMTTISTRINTIVR